MCRMMAVSASQDATNLVAAFAQQAQETQQGPPGERHNRDGWGMAVAGGGRIHSVRRRPVDAGDDTEFEQAAASAGRLQPFEALLVHLRNSSIGDRSIANTHPFVKDGWALAHNGTIRNPERLEIPGASYEGDTDSERYFRLFLAHLRPGENADAALRSTVQTIQDRTPFSSLTALFTDGATIYGYRRLGDDVSDCGTRECQRSYYALGWGRIGDGVVVTQETTYLGDVNEWHEVPDDGLMVWRPPAPPTWRPLRTASAARAT